MSKELIPISLEDAIKALGYSFRSLSYHSDGRWIAKSGAGTGKFIVSAKDPRQAIFKLAKKLERTGEPMTALTHCPTCNITVDLDEHFDDEGNCTA